MRCVISACFQGGGGFETPPLDFSFSKDSEATSASSADAAAAKVLVTVSVHFINAQQAN